MSQRRIILGVLGPVASGKSHVARRIAALGPGTVVDADALAHEALDLAAKDGRLASLFGPASVSGCRADRAALRARAHADPAVLKALEGLTHPYVRERIERAVREHRRGEGPPVLVLDVPLLLEARLDALCDELWYIDCPDELRRQRALARGLSPDALARWAESQHASERKRERATRCLRNDLAPAELDSEIRRTLALPAPG